MCCRERHGRSLFTIGKLTKSAEKTDKNFSSFVASRVVVMIVPSERSAIFVASTAILIIFGRTETSVPRSSAKALLPISAITSLPMSAEIVLPTSTETSLPASTETPRTRGESRRYRSIIDVIKGPCRSPMRRDANGKCRMNLD